MTTRDGPRKVGVSRGARKVAIAISMRRLVRYVYTIYNRPGNEARSETGSAFRW